MRSLGHVLMRSAVDAALPALVLLSLMIAIGAPPGASGGLAGALVFALGFIAHVLVTGVNGAQRALPPILARVFLALGAGVCVLAASAPGLLGSAALFQAGLFACTAAAFTLVFTALIGRVPTLRDDEW
ncbi:MAG: hypothetical protein AB7P07_09635 [Hyphomonadaceae bacterium]